MVDSFIKRPPMVDTFELPSRDEILQVVPGDDIKLIFEGQGLTERMWVRVTNTDQTDEWEGYINNDPLNEEFEYKQLVSFHPQDIISILFNNETED